MSMSPYLRRLRSIVGKELLLLPSVTVLVFDGDKGVFLAKHRSTGRWVAPGGMVEPDESPAESAVREMREETGCEIELLRILNVFGGPQFRVRYENGDEVAYVMTVYEAVITKWGSASDDEIDAPRFVSRTELKRLDTSEWLDEVLMAVWPDGTDGAGG